MLGILQTISTFSIICNFFSTCKDTNKLFLVDKKSAQQSKKNFMAKCKSENIAIFAGGIYKFDKQ